VAAAARAGTDDDAAEDVEVADTAAAAHPMGVEEHLGGAPVPST
jgi:hypothetical protein